MKNQIFVDGVYEYDYELVDDTKHTLYYAKTDQWTSHIRGEIAFQLKDDGNGFKIMTKFADKNRIDYSEVEYLRILLTLSNTPVTYEIASLKPL
jgi:hypothetical protein